MGQLSKRVIEIRSELDRYARETGADLVGWTPLSRADLCKYTLLSEEQINIAQSAMVVAKKHRPEAVKGLRGIPTVQYDRDYKRLNLELKELSQKIAGKLKLAGIAALAVDPSETLDRIHQKGLVSHKIMAEMAGLGMRGRNNLFIPFSPFPPVRLCTILTSLPVSKPVKPSWPYACHSCDNCRQICPVGAIGESWEDYQKATCMEHLDRIATPGISPQICGACLTVCPRN